MCRKSVSRLLIGRSREEVERLPSLLGIEEVEELAIAGLLVLAPRAPGFRKWCASSMITASASSAIRANRAGKCLLRPRSVWLKTARLLKSPPPSTPPMCGRYSTDQRLPDRLLGGLGREEHDSLALVQDQTLDEHQTDERLAETDAVAEEGPAVLSRDLHQRPVRLLLIAIELGKHLRARLDPIRLQ